MLAERFAYELTERLSLNEKYDFHVFTNRWQSDSDRITFHKVSIIRSPRFFTTISFAWFANKKISWVEKCLINNTRCKRFLPVSNLTKKKFLQEYKIKPEKIQVIHPGVDIGRFSRLDREHCRKEIREQFGIDPSDIVILFVSINFEIKELDYVMAAVGKAKASYPSRKIRLLVVGKGDYEKYSTFAQQTSIKDNVIFAGVHKENLEKIYLASDIFMMLSRFDTFGMTVLKAMAASLPVIISSNKKWIRN
jgi:UDP-glucose:(heptosyl)LPS alpha-1,3-glucosyltransferase